MSTPTTNKPAKKKTSMERVMVMLTLFFIVGSLIIWLVPEESPMMGPVMGIFTIAVCWTLYRFGV